MSLTARGSQDHTLIFCLLDEWWSWKNEEIQSQDELERLLALAATIELYGPVACFLFPL